MYVTNSDVQSFKDCRRRWWLSSVRNLVFAGWWGDDSKPGSEAHKGTLVHTGLQVWYTTKDFDLVREALPPTREYMLEGVTYVDEDYAKDRELAMIMLEGYIDWLAETGADANLEIISAESEISADISEWIGAEVTLVGKADLRVRDRITGARRIEDHKTVGAISSDIWPFREQLLTYCLIDRLQHPDEWVDGALVNQLRKVKRTAKANPPFYGRFEVRFNNEEFTAFWQHLVVVIRDMARTRRLLAEGATPAEAGIVPRPSSDCSWRCEFKDVCPMFDDGSRVEDAIQVHFRPRTSSRYSTIPTTQTEATT